MGRRTMMISFAGVKKRYRTTVALDGVNMSIPRGSVTGLVGPNGAGKTTSILLMSTLLSRDEGTVEVGGLDPELDAPGVRRLIGYMPDFFGVYESLTAGEYLQFFAASHGIAPDRRFSLASDLLDLVGLSDRAGDDVNTLSRGMKQRLSLARSLVHDPDLLVLDEPAAGLDPRARVHLRELIAELGRMGKTVVVSSHVLTELEGICSDIVVMDEGRVVAQGPMASIRSSPASDRFIRMRLVDQDVDLASGLLEEDPRVSGLTVESGRIGFSVEDAGDDASAELLARLVGAGVRVSEWRIEQIGLEELFLRITQDTDQ
ncbi:MAG: ABC transporter ATP-binding protein [Acidimicrobiia bacterium]|nr:ABC transporter ATP-binding protein [Acidimicrobiia bacterium]